MVYGACISVQVYNPSTKELDPKTVWSQLTGCQLKQNKIVTGANGRDPEGPVESLDECGSACKSKPPCEAFSYQWSGEKSEMTCKIFSGDATLEEQSGPGTVGYCLTGKFHHKSLEDAVAR